MSMTKRKDNKGRILRDGEYQRKDGRYEYRYTDVCGHPQSVYSWKLADTDAIPAGKRKCESLRAMEKRLQRDVDDGLQTANRQTLNDCFEAFMQNCNYKVTTYTNRRYLYDKYVKNDIGNTKLSSLTFSTILAFYNRLMQAYGLSAGSVKIIHGMIHRILRIAVHDGKIRSNPTEDVIEELRKSNDWKIGKRHAMTEDEQRTFVAYIEHSPTYHHWLPFTLFLFRTGLRIGEACALRWQDIDWESNTISISNNYSYHRAADGAGMVASILTPKNETSKRVIPMFASVREILRDEYKRQLEHGFCKDSVSGYDGFVWVNARGHILRPTSINKAFANIVDSFNAEEQTRAEKEHRDPNLLPHITAHICRHTFSTRMYEQQGDVKTIAEIMGHSSTTTTMKIYIESSMAHKQECFQKIESAGTGIF